MSYWNYRIVKHGGSENYHSLAEVHYDDEGRPEGWCDTSLSHYQSKEQIENALKLMQIALTKHVLVFDGENFEKNS